MSEQPDRFVYRQVPPTLDPRRYQLVMPCEIGENDDPRYHPDLWCDRVVCREFYDEELCRRTVAAMNQMVEP